MNSKDNMYKISIIIPVFNVRNTLQAAFDSLLRQSIGFENLEIIFIDDKSTDGSADILKKFDDDYSNVKAIYLDENSGFAGKPRNVGMENATAKYLMFLDPDDVFLENACELLYENITENNLEVVSGNYNINRDSKIVRNDWNIISLEDKESLEIKNIDENYKVLTTTPSVWAKIFKKDFILENQISFPEGVPGQDLVFVSNALLKAEGIKFINEPVIEYIPRETGENKSVTSKRTKKVLAGFLKSYTELYNIFLNENKEYAWLAPRNLFFWTKQLILSDLPIQDKIDLLYGSGFLYEKFIESDKLKNPKGLDEFMELIGKKDYLNAAILSDKLSIYYKTDNEILETVKTKKIISLFYGMDMNIGGLAKAVFNRSNVINDYGYDVRLLNIDEMKNFEYIISHFKNIGHLRNSIEFINIFDYYSKKNTINELNNKPTELFKIPNGFSEYKNYTIEKIENNDKSITINYYDETTSLNNNNDEPKKQSNDNLIKSEVYMGGYLRIIRNYSHGKLSCEKLFTKDYYNYLTIKYEESNESVTLYDRKMNLNLEFNGLFEFYDYFFNDYLMQFKDNKPYLINECSGIVPDFDNVDPKLAYKIANIHTNPYTGKHCFGSPLRNVAALNNVDKLDKLIVLTNGLKKDLVKEFETENIGVVPNFLDNFEKPQHENINKDYDRIAIFCRLSPEKNLSDAIKAFRSVVDERPNSYLEIYGRALKHYEISEEKRLHELVKELNLEENVLFMGHVENVDEKMATSLATMLVSNIEGLGMVILESMRNATPAICYNVNYGPSDFIIDGVTGRLVEQYDVDGLADAILDVYNNPDKTIEMGKNAQDKILKEINKETLFLKWEQIFKDVYIESEQSKASTRIDAKILKEYERQERIKIELYKEYERQERIKIKLYKENDRLGRKNRLLKNQIEANNNSTIKKMFKRIK